jgi:hypothetical protein
MAEQNAVPEVEQVAPAGEMLKQEPVTLESLAKLLAEKEKLISTLNGESAARRKKLEALEKADEERANAQLSKEQRLEKEVAEAKADAEKARLEANAKLLKSAVLLKAAAMGFEHPSDAFALADLSTVTANEAGDYDEKLIEAILKPLTGRLPVKSQGDRVGTPKLPQSAKQSEKDLATRNLYQKSPRY